MVLYFFVAGTDILNIPACKKKNNIHSSFEEKKVDWNDLLYHEKLYHKIILEY